MTTKSSFYNLIWRREDNVLNLPVGMATSVKSDSESDTLVCDCGKTRSSWTSEVIKMKECGNFICWKCEKEYYKCVDDAWAGWSCPKCYTRTSGTGADVTKTGAVLTLPPSNGV
jgi:hypothetical protein